MQINEVIAAFLAYCSRHRSQATLAFYRARLKKEKYNARDFRSLTPLEIDNHLAQACPTVHGTKGLVSELVIWTAFTSTDKINSPERGGAGNGIYRNLDLSTYGAHALRWALEMVR